MPILLTNTTFLLKLCVFFGRFSLYESTRFVAVRGLNVGFLWSKQYQFLMPRFCFCCRMTDYFTTEVWSLLRLFALWKRPWLCSSTKVDFFFQRARMRGASIGLRQSRAEKVRRKHRFQGASILACLCTLVSVHIFSHECTLFFSRAQGFFLTIKNAERRM